MSPAPSSAASSHWLRTERGLEFGYYRELHAWSTTDLDGFWSAIAEFFAVRFHTPPTAVLGRREMPGAQWFPGATLNYAEHTLRHEGTAVVAYSQTRDRIELTWDQLRDQVARARAGLSGSASGAATGSSPTPRTSPRRSSRSSPPRASARCGRPARPSSAPVA